MIRTILVVDEQPAVVSAFVTALSDAGYAPTGAHSFRDAARLVASTAPDVLVVSVELGPYNGLHLLLRSASESPSTRVIVVGPSNAAVEHEARMLGASGYLARPVTPETIVDRVRALYVKPVHSPPCLAIVRTHA